MPRRALETRASHASAAVAALLSRFRFSLLYLLQLALLMALETSLGLLAAALR